MSTDSKEATQATQQATSDATCSCDDAKCKDQPCMMPRPTFATFILSLASSALVQFGEAPDPATGETKEDIVLAKHTIDMLSMLQEKTKNNLEADEKKLLDGILYELRMKYVVKK